MSLQSGHRIGKIQLKRQRIECDPSLAFFCNVGSRFLFYDCFNTSVKLIQRSVLSALLCLLVTTIAEAGAIVEVQTSLGTFYLMTRNLRP